MKTFATRCLRYVALLCGSTLISITAFAQVIHINDAGSKTQASDNLKPPFKPAPEKYSAIPVSSVQLQESMFTERYALNRKYMLSLENDKLLQNFYFEAGISKAGHITLNRDKNYEDFYWGWESPSNQLRGHFLGHWLSAAAYMYAETNDMEIKHKADLIVQELAECQQSNGGEWAGSIPEKYYDMMARGRQLWSPQYTIHKTLMGLFDMYRLADSKQALEILDKFGDWFYRWTEKQVAANNARAIYGGETSGMLEVWANMYAATGKQKYLSLMKHYGDPELFQALMAGKDPLSGEHANASIPWSHGSARLFEITGNPYWRDVTLAFWKCAVTNREAFPTGGQNAGEFWIPPGQIKNFLTDNNQEHCTVYNMMRTADYLFRATGDIKYADYIERNLYNGIMAQQHPKTGAIAYFLPMAAGSLKGGEKGWGHPTMDFWCCHGSLVQAQVRYPEYIYYTGKQGLLVSQYIPSTLNTTINSVPVKISQDYAAHTFGKDHALNRWKMIFKINAGQPSSFPVSFRLPWWLRQKAIIKLNGVPQKVESLNGVFTINNKWNDDEVSVEFPQHLYTEKLAGAGNTVAFMDGPVLLAGIADNDETLSGKAEDPATILAPEYGQEYKLIRWKQSHYRTTNQNKNIRFVPLYEIGDERYTIFFPVKR